MPPLKKPRPKFLKHPGAQAKPDKPHHPGKPDLDKRKERKPEKKPQKLVESHPLEHRHGRAARRDVYILGVAMSRHDRAACLLKNGQVVGAIGEERLDRRRRSLGSYQSYPRGLVVPPLAAITYLLRLAGISWDRVDLCVCGRSMTLCREALLERVPFPADRVVEPPLPGHHLAHAYSAYGTAPFANCAVLVIDEQGHHIDSAFEKCTWYEGATGPLTLVDRFFGGGDDLSLGMLYNAFAAMTSLTEADSPAAGKLMGLAALGRPHPEWPQLVSLDSARGDTLVSLRRLDEFLAFAGLPRRAPIHEAPLRQLEDLPFYVPVRWDTQLAADLARKAQEELERAVLHIAEAFRRRGVPLHRQQLELQREKVDQAIADDEHREGKAEHREAHDRAIDPRPGLPRGDGSQRDGEQYRDEQCAERERYRRLQALRDHLCHRLAVVDGAAEVAAREVTQPGGELQRERAVEAELRPHLLDLLRGGLVAGNDGRRVAGREMQQPEDDHRHHRHHGDGGEDPPSYIGKQLPSFPRRREPIQLKQGWAPAFAGATGRCISKPFAAARSRRTDARRARR